MKSIIVKLSVALALNTTLAFSASGLIQEEKNLRSTYAYQGLSACQMICDAADAPAAIAYYAVIPGLSFAGSYLPASCQDSFQTGLTYTTYLLHGLSIYANPVKHAVGYTVGGLGVLAAKKLLESSGLSAAQRREIEGAVYFFGRSSGTLVEFESSDVYENIKAFYENIKAFTASTSQACEKGGDVSDMTECHYMVDQLIANGNKIRNLPEDQRLELMREFTPLVKHLISVGLEKDNRATQMFESTYERLWWYERLWLWWFGSDISVGQKTRTLGPRFTQACRLEGGNSMECAHHVNQLLEYSMSRFWADSLDNCKGKEVGVCKGSTDLFRKEGEHLVSQAYALEGIVEESFFSKVLSVFKVDALWIFEFPEIHIG